MRKKQKERFEILIKKAERKIGKFEKKNQKERLENLRKKAERKIGQFKKNQKERKIGKFYLNCID